MHFNSIITAILISGFFVAIARADKEAFKINKLNTIFNKAQHSLGPSKLKDLQNDLKKHEHDELNLKKMKAHNQDKDGLIEASVRKKLLNIMKKYSLERYYDDIHGMPQIKSDAQSSKKGGNSNEKLSDTPTFRDSKLDKLWKKAEKAGFGQEQLMILHEEFQHQQDKLDEHYRTGNLIVEEHDRSHIEHEKLKNSIEHFELETKAKRSSNKKSEGPSEKKARLDENLQQALKEKHSDLKKGYKELHEKIKSGVVDSDKPFEEDQVNELWSLASQSNFTADELQSLKEELEHYQIRIQKLKHFQYQLERNQLSVKDYKTNFDHEDEESKHIRKRVDELSRKVQKAHQSIVGKIIKDEL